MLLDIGLPGMDGYEVCRRFRQSGMEKTRIIAMTGYGLEQDRQRAKAAGFDVHTVKPVAFRPAARPVAEDLVVPASALAVIVCAYDFWRWRYEA